MVNKTYLGFKDGKLSGYSSGYHPDAPDEFVRKSLVQVLINLYEGFPDNHDWSKYGAKKSISKQEKIDLIKMLIGAV